MAVKNVDQKDRAIPYLCWWYRKSLNCISWQGKIAQAGYVLWFRSNDVTFNKLNSRDFPARGVY